MVVSLEKFFMKMIEKLKNKLISQKYNAKHNATIVKFGKEYDLYKNYM